MSWQSIDWNELQRLRDIFIRKEENPGDYWKSRSLLEAYDLTFAARIGWKWDVVIAEAMRIGWRSEAHRWIDWGCGTGVATRRLHAAMGAPAKGEIQLWDQSRDAVAFAREALLREGVDATITSCSAPPNEADCEHAVVLISHVINELTTAALAALLKSLARAETIIWVEPGSYEESHRLIAVREQLRGDFAVLAPCPHQEICGLLKTSSSHWCHHFGHPPVEAFTDGNWARFAKTMNIDLRSLPYSYLILQKMPTARPEGAGFSRVLGHVREYNGFLKVLSCETEEVIERTLQKRDDKALFKQLRKARHFPLQKWVLNDERIVGSE